MFSKDATQSHHSTDTRYKMATTKSLPPCPEKIQRKSLSVPPLSDIHAYPAHIPDDIVKAVQAALTYLEKTLTEDTLEKTLGTALVTEILTAMEIILRINPDITHPIVLERSHPTHTHILTLHMLAKSIRDTYIGCRTPLQYAKNKDAIIGDIREMSPLLALFA